MKTSELRRGNIVEWNRKPFVISRIFEDSVENELWCKPIGEIHPIILTEEILLKCGFEKIDNIQYEGFYSPSAGNQKCRFRLSSSKQGFELIFNMFWSIQIFYLHQLQNLYFVLTNEELKIEL